MATTASFKQQCPSCEAWVPIRDPNLIGRKIDCPKCKYRFVVEDPGTEADADDEAEAPQEAKKPRRDEGDSGAKRRANGKGAAVKGKGGPRRRDEDDEEDDGRPARGKSSGGSTKLILGVGLGVVAVGILVAVAIFIINSNSDTPKPAPQSTAVATTPAPAEPAPADSEKVTNAPVVAPGSAEILTNLLPPDTEGVSNVRMKDLTRTSLGRTIFATPGAFRSEAIQQRLGLAIEDIDLLVQAWSFTQNWSFNVIHTTRPINQDAVKAALRVKPAPEGKIEDQEYFLVEPNAWLDSLGNMTFATLLQINPKDVPARSGVRALRVHDDQTLVLADLAPMKQFLAVKGRFPPKSQPKPATPKDEASEAPGPGAMRGLGGRGPAPAESETPPTPPSGAYLTIKENLKTMLDLLENKQPVLSLAVDTQAARARIPPLGLAALDLATISKLALKTILEEAGVLGASVQLKDGLSLTLAEDCQSEDVARKRQATIRKDIGPKLAELLTAVLNTKAELLDEDANEQGNPFAGGEGPASPGMPLIGTPTRGPGATYARSPGTLRFSGPGGGTVRSPGGLEGRTRYPEESPEPEKEKPGSTIRLDLQEKTVILLTINLIDQAANSRLMSGKIRQLVLQQKGYLDMAGGQLRIHELGVAARTYVEAHQTQFPRGTLERPIPSTRAGRPYEPKQRVSWFAELLPYLGPEQASLYPGIDPKKSWNDPENLGSASTLVPQFLNPNYPPSTWWVRYPNMTELTAATHYVGIAGIGADAAEYSAGDPATAKKLGIFGYDRTTRLEDVTDGVSNTIMIAQVPPTYKRPWMAGGGSTVQGVLEQGSLRPFVSPQPDGKRGTLVVMLDGSVRFVSETIKDDIFKALCTIKGGESNIILDREAPLVPPPEGTVAPVQPLRVQPPSQPTAGAPGEWKEFTSKEGGFMALFPSAPNQMKQSQKTPAGNLDLNIIVVESPDKQASYSVTYFDVPDAVAKQPGTAERFLEAIPQQVKANAAGATITGEIKKVTQDGYPGRELNLELAGKGVSVIRVYLIKNRFYQVMVGGSKEMVSSKEAQRFLDSFHLADK